MTRIILILTILILNVQNSTAQYDIENQSKYQYYKTRFQKNFISTGDDFGESIPFSQRVWNTYYSPDVHRLEGGEHTLVLGNYIAFLGTEYKLYKQSKLSTQGTLKELYYALRAFNRLDYYAETYEKDPTNRKPSLNGFFVREDIPDGFLKDNPSLNYGTIPPDTNTNYGYVKNSGRTLTVTQHGDEDNRPDEKPIHSHMSQDHAIRVLWGLMLAYRCLDDGVAYYEDNSQVGLKSFLDGEHEIKKEIRNIFLRIIQYMKAGENSINQWHIKKPNGDKVEAGSWVGYKKELEVAYDIMNRDLTSASQPPRNSVTGFFSQFGINDWMNRRMQLESQNLSNNNYNTWKRTYKLGYEPYFIHYGILVHDWSFSDEKLKELKETTEFYLNVAPCKGTYYHNDKDYAQFGWASPDRSERSFENTYFGVLHAPGNYNGLDYLLMHNLYYLINFEELGPFSIEKIDSNYSCDEGCQNLNKTVMKKEIKRVEKRTKKHCKRTCKQDKKRCKNDAKNTKRACISNCHNTLRGRARRQCKKSCRKIKRKTKKSCRKTKKSCRSNCKNLQNDYEQKLYKLKSYCN